MTEIYTTVQKYYFWTLVVFLGLAAGFRILLGCGVWLALVISSNIMAWGLCGLDKRFADSQKIRFPERLILFSAIPGGGLGLLIGMGAFRHKTKKGSFQIWAFVIALVQAVLVLKFNWWPH